MKLGALLLALVLPASGLLPRGAQAIDDPPPEPIDCPMCGGDPALHIARTFALLDTGSVVAARVLRW